MANDRSGALGFVPFLEPETPDNPYQDRFVAGFKDSDGLQLCLSKIKSAQNGDALG
jgi:hypothetical protein